MAEITEVTEDQLKMVQSEHGTTAIIKDSGATQKQHDRFDTGVQVKDDLFVDPAEKPSTP